MFATLPIGFMWAGLAAITVLGALAIDRMIRLLVNQFTRTQSSYPHRVANQLPRVLHKGDHDEVLEMTDDREVTAR
jgi:hypothetical protein